MTTKNKKNIVSSNSQETAKDLVGKFDFGAMVKNFLFGPSTITITDTKQNKSTKSKNPKVKPVREKRDTAARIRRTRADSMDDINDSLLNIYSLLVKTQDAAILKSELEKNKQEEKETEDEKRHKELLDALGKLTSTPTATKLDHKSFTSVGSSISNITGKIGGFIADKVKKIVGKKALKAAVKKMIIKKGLKTALKKVPLIGAAAGLLFGVEKAISGDFNGAALEATSGLAGTIPGFGTVASLALDTAGVAREVYKELYGVYPLEAGDDPDERSQRMTEISGAIKEIMESPNDIDEEPSGKMELPAGVQPSKAGAGRGSGGPTAAELISAGVASTESPSQRMVSATSENVQLQNTPSIGSGSTTTINNTNMSGSTKRATSIPIIPSVRNQEETFKRLIYNSTRVV